MPLHGDVTNDTAVYSFCWNVADLIARHLKTDEDTSGEDDGCNYGVQYWYEWYRRKKKSKRKAKENGLKYPILIAPLFAQLICSALLCGGGCCGAAYVILPMDGGMGFCRMVGGRCRKKVKSNARFNCPNADGE